MGRALFRVRGLYPLPLLLAQRLWGDLAPGWPGLTLIVLGEALRLWAAGCIGLPSRTRGDTVGPLVEHGPYALVRNPLYVGNWLIWVGVGALAGPAWALVWALWIGVQVHWIVRWEEGMLGAQLGAAYQAYAARVPRWLPRRWALVGGSSPGRALRSERSTLLALGGVLLVLLV